MNDSASGCAIAWCAPIGVFQTCRSFAYSVAFASARRAVPQAKEAPMMRSGLSPAKSWSMPASSLPISVSAGSRTSSKKSVNCFSGDVIPMSISL